MSATEELPGMPATSPKVYFSGTPTPPDGLIFGSITKAEISNVVEVTLRCTITAAGDQVQDEGTRGFVRLRVDGIKSAKYLN